MRNDDNVIKFIEEQFSDEILMMIRDYHDDYKDKIIDYVIEVKAWNDMVIYDRFNKSSVLKNSKPEICKYLKGNLNFKRDSNYRGWLSSVICHRLKEKCSEMNIGLAQKLVNMSVKYFYFLERGYNICLFSTKLSNFSDEFDIPIDSYILKWIIYNSTEDDEFIESQDKIKPWTKLDDWNTYTLLNTMGKKLLNEKYNFNCLVSETIVWENIKKLKERCDFEL